MARKLGVTVGIAGGAAALVALWLKLGSPLSHEGMLGEPPEIRRFREELARTRPEREAAVRALQESGQIGFVRSLSEPASIDAGMADTAYERIAFGARQDPPFGPQRMGLGASEEALLQYEKTYYESHAAEYDRFMATWGDIHELR
jgi:hypothetical protein